MLKRLLTGALFAGVAAGCLGALLQLAFVVPLIAEAELYETGALVHFGGVEGAGHDHAAPAAAAADHDHPPGTPPHDHGTSDGAARLLGNVAMFLVTYTGFALLLVAGFAVAEGRGHAVSWRTGLIWGLAGFAATQLAPAFGLPPELPGGAGADLQARQIWWVFCAIATAGGLAALAFGRGWVLALAVVLIALPHIIGAPTAAPAGVIPPELAAHYAARALGVGAVVWALLGATAGAIWQRQG